MAIRAGRTTGRFPGGQGDTHLLITRQQLRADRHVDTRACSEAAMLALARDSLSKNTTVDYRRYLDATVGRQAS